MGALWSDMRLNGTAPRRARLGVVALLALFVVDALGRPAFNLRVLNTWVALIRNGACVLKNLQEDYPFTRVLGPV